MATNYELEYREQGGQAQRVSVASPPHALSGLSSSTTYEWRVRTDNVDNGVHVLGRWTAWQSFTTSVLDTEKPVITLIGDAAPTITETEAQTWVDPGATATDNTDGDISGNIVVTGSVGTSPGIYTLYYDVTDAAGNAADTVTRTVTVVADDTEKPVITLIDDAEITLTTEQVQSWVDPGATATDNVDGDISGNIVVTGSVSTEPGTYILYYDVTDAAGNAADTVTRVVRVAEVLSATAHDLEWRPVGGAATLVQDIPGLSYSLSGLSANTDYEFRVRAKNGSTLSDWSTWSAFSTSAIVDTEKPVITLIGAADITITDEEAATWVDPGATATDNIDGDISGSIVVTGSVGTSPGTYTLYYDVTDAAGNAADTVTRTVTVVSTAATVPVVTLLGPKFQRLNPGETWIDPGATAQDDTDGDLTANIVVSNAPNPYVAGTYEVRYSVTNSHNISDEKIRLVTVNEQVTPDEYEYEVLDAGSVVIDSGTTTSAAALTGLETYTKYGFRVRARLSGGETSSWSDTLWFITAADLSLTPTNRPVTATDAFVVWVDNLTTTDRRPVITGRCSKEFADITVTVDGQTFTTFAENGTWRVLTGEKLGLSSPDELVASTFQLLLSGDAQESGTDGLIP